MVWGSAEMHGIANKASVVVTNSSYLQMDRNNADVC